ncbi:hypothetical protein [Streptomyces sp. NPDC004267]|uniref:hypothetical protein n=1 Tax=Streptomyces sp. NPDC004267 TaxID=3364694 RepID=UPI0036B0E9C5
MNGAPVADQINRLPFERWLRADELAQWFKLPADQAVKIVRAGRRQGSLTVRGKGPDSEVMRVHRHRLPSARQ